MVARRYKKPSEGPEKVGASKLATTRLGVRLVLLGADRNALALVGPNGAVASEELLKAFGSTDHDFLENLFGQLKDDDAEGKLDFAISVITGLAPRDQVETMLAAQMAAVHMASMKFGKRLRHVQTIEEQDSTSNAFNKLTRTFTSQMEALKRYRTGGEQKVTVQHVTVSEGGNAIVGNVTQASSEPPPDKKATRSIPLIEHPKTAPMPELDLSKKRTAAPVRRKARQ